MVVQLKTKQDFKNAREKYSGKSKVSWKMYMWEFFKDKTCYIVSEDCFISLDKAKQLKYI